MTEYSTQSYVDAAALLHSIPGVGQKTLRTIIGAMIEYQTIPESFRLSLLNEIIKKYDLKLHINSVKKIDFEQKINDYKMKLSTQNIRVLIQGGEGYPSKLEQLYDPPFLLYAVGRDLNAVGPALAVVGSRRCTPYGVRATKQIVTDFCQSGVATIISGLMYGIDAQAHQIALACRTRTVAVLGYGIGHWFPRQMHQLGSEIVQAGGVLLSEYPPGMPPTKGTFLERNRLVAGLADAVLVPEAAARSGTQRTVAIAAELGILVGAVPGPFDSEFSHGTKEMINQGAILVTSADDILSELGLGKVAQLEQEKRALSPIEVQLQAGPCGIDELCLTTQLSVVQLSFELSSLELAGRIVRRGGQWYRV